MAEEDKEEVVIETDNKENEVELKETTGEGEPSLKDLFDLMKGIEGVLVNMQQVQDTQIPIESDAEEKEEEPAETPEEEELTDEELDALLHED